MATSLKFGKVGRPPAMVPTVVIDKHVPLPSFFPQIQFPFGDMDVGDSFFVEARLDATSMLARVRSKFRYWRISQCPRPKVAVTVRKVEGGVRCWRIE